MSPDHVAIVGSRRFPSRLVFEQVVTRSLRFGDTVVSGGARGPDSWAEEFVQTHFELGLGLRVFPASWEKPCIHGDRHRRFHPDGRPYWTCQGFARNSLIVEACTRVLAFVMPDRTGGTEDTVAKALQAGKPVRCVLPDGRTTAPDPRRVAPAAAPGLGGR